MPIVDDVVERLWGDPERAEAPLPDSVTGLLRDLLGVHARDRYPPASSPRSPAADPRPVAALRALRGHRGREEHVRTDARRASGTPAAGRRPTC